MKQFIITMVLGSLLLNWCWNTSQPNINQTPQPKMKSGWTFVTPEVIPRNIQPPKKAIAPESNIYNNAEYWISFAYPLDWKNNAKNGDDELRLTLQTKNPVADSQGYIYLVIRKWSKVQSLNEWMTANWTSNRIMDDSIFWEKALSFKIPIVPKTAPGELYKYTLKNGKWIEVKILFAGDQDIVNWEKILSTFKFNQ
jgi:hypothetical protein